MLSDRALKSSKLSCMSSLPAGIKMIQSKMEELEWSHHLSHYKYEVHSKSSRTASIT